jgi:hypothetical protein
MGEENEGSKRAVVVREYWAQYGDPIRMRSGDTVTVGPRDAEYVGWIWRTPRDGRSGWAPESFLAIEGGQGRAMRDCSA